MQSEFLEIGQIVNTHGIRGEVKLVPWADSPEFVCQFNTLYADGAPLKVTSARVHKGNVIAKLEGIVKHLDIPTSLTEFGVPKEDLEALVASGMEVTRLLVNNMREVTPDDARRIYQEVL